MSVRRLLVTGVSGFVGSWIARSAVRSGLEVHGLVRSESVPERVADLAGKVAWHRADLRESGRVEEVVRRLRPTWVMHAAFPAMHGADATARREMVEAGILGTANLLEAIRATDSVSHVVQVGSAMAYGPSDQAHQPTDPLWPVTFRGTCKAGTSLLCRQLALATGLKYTEARLFTAYGPWERRELLLPRLLQAGLTGGTVRLTPQPQARNWVHVEDVADACLAAFAMADGGPQVFNVCGEEVISNHEAARLLEGITGRRLVEDHGYGETDRYEDPNPRGVMSGGADGVSWRPRHRFADGLRAYWAWAQTADGRRHLGLG